MIRAVTKILYDYNTPDPVDINIYRGATWVMEVILIDGTGQAVDITGYTPKMEIRKASDDTLVETPTPTVISAAGGSFKFALTGAETLAMVLTPPAAGGVKLVYDAWLLSGSENVAIFEGLVKVYKNVTAV